MPVSLPTCDHHYELNDRRRPDQRPGTSGTARLGARPGRLQRRLAPGPGPRRLGPHALSESITSSVRSDYVEAPEVQELLDLVTSVRSRLSNGGGGPRRSQAGLLAPGPGAGAAPGSTLIRVMNIGIGTARVEAAVSIPGAMPHRAGITAAGPPPAPWSLTEAHGGQTPPSQSIP